MDDLGTRLLGIFLLATRGLIRLHDFVKVNSKETEVLWRAFVQRKERRIIILPRKDLKLSKLHEMKV